MPSTLLIFAVREPITFTFQSRIYWLLPFSFNLTLPFDFFFLYWSVWVIYITWVLFIPLSDIFATIFSHFATSPFPFVDHSFGCAEAFQFDIAPLINFCFCFLYFWCRPKKKSLPRPMSGSFSPVFSSRNFTVLGLMFVFNLFWVNFCLTLRFENHSLLAYLLINLWMPPFPPPLTHIPFVLPDLTKGHLFRETFDQDFRNLGTVWEPPG